MQHELVREQGELLGKYRRREQKLAQIDSAQQEVLLQVKHDINVMEESRQRLVEDFRKVGGSFGHLEFKYMYMYLLFFVNMFLSKNCLD